MKIGEYTTPVEEETIGDFKEISSNISNKDLGFALNAVSKNLYSNPIGSFIREIVSNAVDANTENNSDKPVLVDIYKENGINYFRVKDNGIGMSETFFEEVYMSWFNSSKRENNNLIGGWGIGSKSPLAYTDNYELETIHNNIKYSYYIYKTSAEPKATLINKEDLNDFPNAGSGTTIKFEVKESDLWKIYNECKNQLLYFSNVVVTHNSYFYDNTYNILESDLFRYNTLNTTLNNLHICIGNVPYKIDFNLLDMPIIEIPLGLKFNIGELPVVLSRESINYEDDNIDVISIIKDKINLFLEDVNNRLNNQRNFENITDYINHIYNESKTIYLQLGEYKIKIPKDIINNKRTIYNEKGIEIELNKKTIDNIVELITTSGIIGNDKKYYTYDLNDRTIYKDVNYNMYSNLYHKGKQFVSIKKFNSIIDEISVLLKYGTKEKYGHYIHKPNYLLVSKLIYSAISNRIISSTYENYSEYPDWFKLQEDEKNNNKVNKESITIYNCNNNREEISFIELEKYKYIFYIIKDDAIDWKQVANFETLFNNFRTYFKKELKFILVSSSVIKRFKKDNRFKPAIDVFKYKKLINHYSRILISKEYYNLEVNSVYGLSNYYKDINDKIRRNYNIVTCEEKRIWSKYDKNGTTYVTNTYSFFLENLLKVKHKRFDYFIYYNHIEELRKVSDVIRYCNIISRAENTSNNNKTEIIQYILRSSKNIKLNRNYGKERN